MSKLQNKKTKSKSRTKSRQEKSRLYRAVVIILALAFIVYMAVSNLLTDQTKDNKEYQFKKEGELVFLDSNNVQKKKIDIEIADTDFDRQLGLMFREKMEDSQGMLFIFPSEDYHSFWMRNTKISLDMIFVSSKKKIVTIHKNTAVLSDQSYPSSEPVKFVIEVIAGFTDKYSITVGDKVDWMETKINL